VTVRPTERPSDQLVDAKSILDAITDLKRRGNNAILQELESIEQKLASFIMEEQSLIHQTLLKTGARTKLIRRLMQQIEAMALVSILAMRQAQLRLWHDPDETDDGQQRGAPEPQPHT
jgi:hypothetical protein